MIHRAQRYKNKTKKETLPAANIHFFSQLKKSGEKIYVKGQKNLVFLVKLVLLVKLVILEFLEPIAKKKGTEIGSL